MNTPRTDKPESTPLHILISGASGLIGRELTRQLTADGHTIKRLVRRATQSTDEINWTPGEGQLRPEALDGIDAIINFSGAPLMHLPWKEPYRIIIRDSRVNATRTITDAMNARSDPPPILLNASAAGFYGHRPGEELTEKSARGTGFLSDVVVDWESAANTAPSSTRVVTFRTGIVLANDGTLAILARLAKLGLAGPLGDGTQNWPWISLHDEAAAIRHLLTSQLAGPVNLAGPLPATAEQLIRRLAEDLHRPYWLPAPKKLLNFALRDAADELLLVNQKVVPAQLTGDGFTWKHTSVDQAVDAAIFQDD